MIELPPTARARVRRGTRRLTFALAIALAAVSQGCVLDADLGGWTAEDAGDDGSVEAAAPGADAELDAGAACAGDAAACANSDAGSEGWTLKVKIGPATSYFADGRSLPEGEYSIVYVDGCWKSGVVAWTVNLGVEGYWVVGGEPEQQLDMAPGTSGTFATLGAYGTYAECVAANSGRAGVTFRHPGGPLGLKLEPIDPFSTQFILLEGGESQGGQSPTFRLTCSSC